jgi:predicted DNA-binding transcriptional regulator AlpA
MQEISDSTGVSLSTLNRWKKEQALPLSHPSKGVVWSPEIRSRVFTYLAQNMSKPQIFEKTGVPISTIDRWRNDEIAATFSRSAEQGG